MPVFSSYANICEVASKNDDVFSSFKRIKEYYEVLEHVTDDQGTQYLNFIEKNYEYLVPKIKIFSSLDLIGNPLHLVDTKYGKLSPTTLRYVKVLGDLNLNFGDLKKMNIAEIGSGYGGQAKVIMDSTEEIKYTCYDLPEVCLLINRYLGLTSHKFFTKSSFENDESYDLCISNYAFSELPREKQDEYFENVISKSKNGYFTMNFISHLFGVNSYSLDEFIEKLKNCDFEVKVLDETPQTFKNQNKIVIW